MKKLIRNFNYWENYKMYIDLMKKTLLEIKDYYP